MYHKNEDDTVESAEGLETCPGDAASVENGLFENTLKSHSGALCGASQDSRPSPGFGDARVTPPGPLATTDDPATAALGPSGAVEALRDAAEDLAQKSLSAATLRSYGSAWRKFLAFCERHALPVYGEPETLALWIAEQVDGGAKLSTIEQGLSAVAKAWNVAGCPNPRDDRLVRSVYSGARRTLGVAGKGVDALSAKQLREVIEALPTGMHDDLRSARTRAMLSMGWSGGFRVSELLALKVEDVSIVDEGLLIQIRRSKTDQEGRGRAIGLPYASTLATCPVRSYIAWRKDSQINSGAVFRRLSPDGLTLAPGTLTSRQVINVVASAAKRAGLDGRFASHSLRVGFVTDAMKARKNPRTIMQQTGHHSVSMVMRYARDGQVFDDNAAEGLL